MQAVDGESIDYLWDEYSPYGDVLLETDAGGAPLVSYTLANGQLISQVRDGVPSYYLTDGQGSVRALVDGGGVVTDTYAYTAFGELYAQTGGTENSYLYTGQQFDGLTGLYSLRARYYDPGLGRFLSQDTAGVLYGNPLELNRYAYSANDPVNHIDPSGLNFVEYAINSTISIVAAGILGGLGGYLFHCLAASGICGPAFQDWADNTTAEAAARTGYYMGLGIGFALFLYPGLLPYVMYGSAGLSTIGAVGSAVRGDAQGALCSLITALLSLTGGSAGRSSATFSIGPQFSSGEGALVQVGIMYDLIIASATGALSIVDLFAAIDGGGGAPQSPAELRRRLNRLKEHLTDSDLRAAQQELQGEIVKTKPSGEPYDHLQEVRDAQNGLRDIIRTIQGRLSDANPSRSPSASEITELQSILAEASQLLDYSEQFVP